MATLTIERQGCRSCSMCKDICPTEVFDLDDQQIAVAARPEDCIGCTSCEAICPSRCLTVSDIMRQRPFYRIEENVRLVSRFLRRTPMSSELTDSDWEEALRDVTTRLRGIAASIVETMGRGQRVVGRKAGQLTAERTPEAYEAATVESILQAMQAKFNGCYKFAFSVEPPDEAVTIRFERCPLTLLQAEEGPDSGGEVLCSLLKEYWAGLISASTGRTFAVEQASSQCPCTVVLRARE